MHHCKFLLNADHPRSQCPKVGLEAIKDCECIIIHGSPEKDLSMNKNYTPDNELHWLPWLKRRLEKNGVNAACLLMPTPWLPKYKEWIKEFRRFRISNSTILVGHSAGGAFLVRWLGETNRKIKKLILIAPAKVIGKDLLRLKDFCNCHINKKIINNVKKIILFV